MTKWKLVPVEPTPEMIIAIEKQWMVGSAMNMARREFIAAIEAAPQPPKLSDERILEIWASNSGRPVTMGRARIIAQARAIEREILGGES